MTHNHPTPQELDTIRETSRRRRAHEHIDQIRDQLPTCQCGSHRVVTGSLGDRSARHCWACGRRWNQEDTP
jgi:hypothetical protein